MVHAGWNALAKRAHDPLVFLWSSVSLASLGLMPLGIWAIMRGGWAPGGAPFVAATVGIHAVYFFALGRAYATGDLSLVYPVARGLGVALVPPLAFLFLDERLSAVGALGIVLVVAGIIRMGVLSRAPAVRLPRERGPRAAGLVWAILTGLTVAAYSVVDKAGVALVHPLAYISLMGIGMSAALAPVITYDERAVTIGWTPGPEDGRPDASRLVYHVYELRSTASSGPTGAPGAAGGPSPADADSNANVESRLTAKPVTELRYEDRRIEWGARRCYTVRAVQSIGGLTVESDAPTPACATLVDTFPPPPPSGLEPIASDGAISLIWDPSEAPDLAGYVVLRGPAGGRELTPVTPSPIAEASFRDVVPSGGRFVYAVQAVDKAGNRSAPSDHVEETAR
jgi:multidrug transporter EmrE-like cation transporter